MGETHGPELTEDRLLGGAVRLLQPRRGHRAGTDAVLLAGLVPIRDGETIVDLGSSTGAVGLMVARRNPASRILFVERDTVLVDICRRNIALNGVGARAETVEADLFEDGRRLPAGTADVVLTNPPFWESGSGRLSPDPGRRSAHVMHGGGLAAWVAAGAALLKPKGRFGLIHRADQLELCLSALNGRIGGVSLTFIHSHEGRPATRLLITGRKGSRAALQIEPAIILHGPDGGFTGPAAALHGA